MKKPMKKIVSIDFEGIKTAYKIEGGIQVFKFTTSPIEAKKLGMTRVKDILIGQSPHIIKNVAERKNNSDVESFIMNITVRNENDEIIFIHHGIQGIITEFYSKEEIFEITSVSGGDFGTAN
jgi:hypothetical protein